MKYPGLLIASSLLILSAAPARADFTAKILSIGDGDTIAVQKGNQKITIRLACIDAPETAQKPWGEPATAKLKALLPIGSAVRVRDIELDRYGRTVGEIFSGNQSANLEMVKAGQSVIYRQYFGACSATANQYNQAETAAKTLKLGFWNQSCPLMPWDFRSGLAPSCQGKPIFRGFVPGTCTALAAQGIYGPFYRSQNDPNYTAARDRDNDGIACER